MSEVDQVIVTQFGNPIGEAVTEAGLHFKVPFIQKTNYFDKRFLEWDGNPNQVPTKDKRFIWVDTYARWYAALREGREDEPLTIPSVPLVGSRRAFELWHAT